jgi:hypothetical protein
MWIYLAGIPLGIPLLAFPNLQTSSRSDPRLPRKKYAAAPITMAKKRSTPASIVNDSRVAEKKSHLCRDNRRVNALDESRKGGDSQRCSS